MFEGRLPGFFELAEAIVDAIAEGQFVKTQLPDGCGDGLVVHEAAIPFEYHGGMGVGSFLMSAFAKQMTNSELMTQIPRKFTFGMMPYGGKTCFSFRWPEDKDIDVGMLRDHILKAKELVTEVNPDNVKGLELPFEDAVALGPMSEGIAKEFGSIAVYLNMYAYDEQFFDDRFRKIQDSYFYFYERGEYLNLFKHEIEFQPAYKAPQSDFDASGDDFVLH